MSADTSARSVSHVEGVDPVRALQRVLYRSAKQDPARRFHALYDKLARSDVMWRAWIDVATNWGLPVLTVSPSPTSQTGVSKGSSTGLPPSCGPGRTGQLLYGGFVSRSRDSRVRPGRSASLRCVTGW